jgi:hypothetical protein
MSADPSLTHAVITGNGIYVFFVLTEIISSQSSLNSQHIKEYYMVLMNSLILIGCGACNIAFQTGEYLKYYFVVMGFFVAITGVVRSLSIYRCFTVFPEAKRQQHLHLGIHLLFAAASIVVSVSLASGLLTWRVAIIIQILIGSHSMMYFLITMRTLVLESMLNMTDVKNTPSSSYSQQIMILQSNIHIQLVYLVASYLTLLFLYDGTYDYIAIVGGYFGSCSAFGWMKSYITFQKLWKQVNQSERLNKPTIELITPSVAVTLAIVQQSGDL